MFSFSTSAPVTIVAVILDNERKRVSVLCSDGRVRVCSSSVATKALGKTVTAQAIYNKLLSRVGMTVQFHAAFGYSANDWFCACNPA
jgi:hypothetical protein